MGHCSSGKHRLAADSHWTVGLYNVTIHTVVEDTWYSEKSTLALLNRAAHRLVNCSSQITLQITF